MDCKTKQELARLQDPNQDRSEYCQFTPDGGKLIVVSHIGRRVHVWDFRLIGKQLDKMGLGWDLPPFPDVQSVSSKPLQLKIDCGTHKIEMLTAEKKWAEAIAEASKEIKKAPENADLL